MQLETLTMLLTSTKRSGAAEDGDDAADVDQTLEKLLLTEMGSSFDVATDAAVDRRRRGLRGLRRLDFKDFVL